MFLIRLFLKLIFVVPAALAGNLVGYRMREQMLGQTAPQLRLYQKSEEGEITIAVNPIFTNLIPALLIGMLSRSGVLAAFLVGAVVAALIGDEYEDKLFALLGIH